MLAVLLVGALLAYPVHETATACTNECRARIGWRHWRWPNTLGAERDVVSAARAECDDGGVGAVYDYCAYGTDCDDCGPRVVPSPVLSAHPTGGGSASVGRL